MTTPSDHPLRAGLGLWSYTVCALAVKQLYMAYTVQSAWPDGTVFQWLSHDPNLLASAVGGALVAAGWTLLLPMRPRVWALAITNLLVSTLMVADYLSLQHGGNLISLRDVLQQPDGVGVVADSIAGGLRPGYVLYLVDAVVIILAVRSRGPADGRQSVIPRILASAAATLVGIMLIAPTLEDAGDRQTNGDAPPHQSWPTLGVVPYHLIELIRGHSRSSLNASDTHVVRIRLADRRRPRRSPAPLNAAPATPPQIDQDGLVFREGPLLGRLRRELDGFTPFTPPAIECGLPAVHHDVNCDVMRRLQTAQALLDPSGH